MKESIIIIIGMYVCNLSVTIVRLYRLYHNYFSGYHSIARSLPYTNIIAELKMNLFNYSGHANAGCYYIIVPSHCPHEAQWATKNLP